MTSDLPGPPAATTRTAPLRERAPATQGGRAPEPQGERDLEPQGGRDPAASSELLRSVSSAYTAAHGHPVEHDTLVERETERRRWAVGLRTALVALVALLMVAGVVVVRDLRAVSAEPVPLSDLGATTAAQSPERADGTGDAGDEVGDRGAPGGRGGEPDAADPGDGDPGGAESGGADLGGAGSGDGGPTVLVHVVGRVHSPGVVEVPEGSRVVDAIDAAGGLTPEADSASVNLARPAVDGEQVYVPAPGEDVPVAPEVAAGTASPGAGAPATGGLVDLNRATADELQVLPGVGPALAQRVLDWRGDHGAFGSVDQLQDVAGIGPVVMERLRDLVTVGQ